MLIAILTANYDHTRAETRHLCEIHFLLIPDIYTVEENCLFIQTSIDILLKNYYLVDEVKANFTYHALPKT